MPIAAIQRRDGALGGAETAGAGDLHEPVLGLDPDLPRLPAARGEAAYPPQEGGEVSYGRRGCSLSQRDPLGQHLGKRGAPASVTASPW